MKAIKKSIFALAIIAITVFSGCEDFLDYSPNDRVTLDNFFRSESDLNAGTAGLYNIVWFDFNDKFYYALGDGRANNLFAPYSDYIYPFTNLTETSLTGPLVSAWRSFYNVIGQSNNTINNITKHARGVTEQQKNRAIAEARFMRGTAYWYLASLWGNVIIIEDNSLLVNNPVVNTHTRDDVFEFAMRDLEFAARHLPARSWQPGRLTKWSAYGMLSRVYLSVSGISDDVNSGVRNPHYLELARQAAGKVAKESGLTLMANYADLFKVENNNNPESLFALQWVPNGEYGVTNTHQAFFASHSRITGDDAAWGAYTMASYNMMREYHPLDDIRRKATFMARGDHYPEIARADGGYIHEPSDWRANVKKGVVGSPRDTDGKSGRMNSALNTYMLRLAEVYLIYAEAVLGNNASTSDASALNFFNMVRTRAGMPTLSTITFENIRYERRIELAMEGQYWYDLVRRAYYRQQEVLNYMNGQDRSRFYSYDKDTDTTTPTTAANINIEQASPARMLLPYPESEVIQNPLLRQPPVSFNFTEERITDLFNNN